MQSKGETKLLAVIALTIKHGDCRIAFFYIFHTFVKYDNFSELI